MFLNPLNQPRMQSKVTTLESLASELIKSELKREHDITFDLAYEHFRRRPFPLSSKATISGLKITADKRAFEKRIHANRKQYYIEMEKRYEEFNTIPWRDKLISYLASKIVPAAIEAAQKEIIFEIKPLLIKAFVRNNFGISPGAAIANEILNDEMLLSAAIKYFNKILQLDTFKYSLYHNIIQWPISPNADIIKHMKFCIDYNGKSPQGRTLLYPKIKIKLWPVQEPDDPIFIDVCVKDLIHTEEMLKKKKEQRRQRLLDEQLLGF